VLVPGWSQVGTAAGILRGGVVPASRPGATHRASVAEAVAAPAPSLPVPPYGIDVLEGLLRPAEADVVVGIVRGLRSSFCTDPDSVDSHPSFELRVITGGEWHPEGGPLRSVLEKPFEELQGRVNCLRRSRNALEDVVVSQVLIRRYVAGERRSHPVHYDHHALITAVCSLTVPHSGSGLFVQLDALSSSREFVELGVAGNFLIHDWKLLHGVEVQGNEERFSLIAWLKPACDVRGSGTSWYDDLAAAGDADAQFRLGMRCEQGGNDTRAHEWFLQAASKAQHWPSMYRLGVLLRRQGDLPGATCWLRAAAQTGFAEAQVAFGDLLSGWGWGEVERTQRCEPHSEASRLYEAAAAQGSPAGQQRLARLRLQEGDAVAAERLLRAAAAQGSAVAQTDLAELLMSGGFEEEAISWFERADELRPSSTK